MNDKEKDLILINSYLDRELSESESLQFTKRIAADPTLASEIEELHAVKTQLKRLADVKAPRKYILTRAEAAAAKPPSLLERLFPAFRWSAAVSMLALMVLILMPMMTRTASDAPIMAAKSVTLADNPADQDFSLESVASGAVQPLTVTQNGLNADESADAPRYFSSQGVRGGSPKMEVLVNAERKFPVDRTFLDAETDEAAEAAALAALNPNANERTNAPISIRRILIWAAAAMFAMSVAWMGATLGRRAWARR